jgi:adenylyl cyclase-associated protein
MSVEEPAIPKNLSGTATAAPATPEPPKPSPPPPAAPAAPQIPPQIQDFDALIKGDVQNFVKLGAKIGGLVEEQVRLINVGIGLEPRLTGDALIVQSRSASIRG